MLALPLRAYAMLSTGGAIEVSVHRDLATTVELWNEACAMGDSSPKALFLHVGAGRPDSDAVAELLMAWGGRVVLSESTRWCLPEGFDVSAGPIARLTTGMHTASLPCYLGLTGWGYVAEQPEALTVLEAAPLRGADHDGWLDSLRTRLPHAAEALVTHGIGTETAYVQRRAEIPLGLRDEVDNLRFEDLLPTIDAADPFAVLQIAPEWLLDFPVEEAAELTVRVRNCLIKEGLNQLGELLHAGPARVLSMENFGRKSYETLAPAIIDLARRKAYRSVSYPREGRWAPDPLCAPRPSGEPSPQLEEPSPQSPGIAEYRSLWAGLHETLAAIAPRDRIVLEERLGWTGPPKKLEAIGEALGVTRERARQLESRGLRELARQAWSTDLSRRLDHLLAGRKEPLYLDLLGAEDEWFEQFDDHSYFLGCLIERLNEDVFHTWKLSGRLVLTRVRETTWEELERETRTSLAEQIDAKLTPSDVRLIAESAAAAAGCPELGGALFDALEDHLQFATDRDTGEEVLSAVGRSIRSTVASIILAAPEPLEIEEVVRQCTERIGETPSELAVRGALAAAGALPFTGRRYAMEHHLRFSEAEILAVLRAAEQEMQAGEPGRQWHCFELCEALSERHNDLPPGLDRYELNMILRRSEAVNYLGRLVWVLRSAGVDSARDRLDLADLARGILTQAGHPLTSAEIRARMSELRGVNATLLLVPDEHVARLAPGLWGLVTRDFGLADDERVGMFADLTAVLSHRKKALHVSEIRSALTAAGTHLPDLVTGEMILGLCQIEPRFRLGRGDLLGLAEWDSMNRLTVRGAIREAIREHGGLISPVLLYERVDTLAERKVERFVIHTELRSLGFVLDEQRGIWSADPLLADSAE